MDYFPARTLRQLGSVFVMCFLLSVSVTPESNADMPPTPCPSCHLNGWWSSLVSWGDVAIHMALLKDETIAAGSLQSQSQIVW